MEKEENYFKRAEMKSEALAGKAGEFLLLTIVSSKEGVSVDSAQKINKTCIEWQALQRFTFLLFIESSTNG